VYQRASGGLEIAYQSAGDWYRRHGPGGGWPGWVPERDLDSRHAKGGRFGPIAPHTMRLATVTTDRGGWARRREGSGAADQREDDRHGKAAGRGQAGDAADHGVG